LLECAAIVSIIYMYHS